MMERPIMDRNVFNSLFKFVDNVIKRFDGKMIKVRVYKEKKTHTHTGNDTSLYYPYFYPREKLYVFVLLHI